MDDDQQNEQHSLLAWILGIAVTVAVAVSLFIGILAGTGGDQPAAAGAPAASAAGASTTEASASAAPAADASTAGASASGASASGASSTDASATGASAAGAATGAAAGTAASAVAVEAVEVDVAPALATGAGIPELVRFYFETGQAALPADANAQLAALIDWARGTAGARIGISGYHDKQGNAALNAELAKNRARAARQALLAAGVPAERVILVKPQETSGGADDREARRVEVYPAQ